MVEQNRILLTECLLDKKMRDNQEQIKKKRANEGSYLTTMVERRGVHRDDHPRFIPLMLKLMEDYPPETLEYLSDLRGYKNNQWYGEFTMSYPQAVEIPSDSSVSQREETADLEYFKEMNRRISSTFRWETLEENLDFYLTKLGISCCSLFLFQSQNSNELLDKLLPPEEAKQVYSLESSHAQQGIMNFGMFEYSFLRWVPSNCHRLLLPLNHEDSLMGFMIVEDRSDYPYELYESFRILLSNFLAGQSLKEELEALSLYDDLTGVYNSRGLYTLGEQLIVHAKRLDNPITLFYIDIDRLKEINQHKGRSYGDQILKDSAALLQKLFRKNDVIGRVGPDEFAVLAMGVSQDNDNMLLQRLYNALDEWNHMKPEDEKFHLKVNLSRLEPEDPFSLRDMLTMADYLMSEKKEETT